MPTLIDNDPGGFSFTRDQWKERIAAFMPGGGDVFSDERSEAVVEGDIPWEVRYSFVRTVLGYAYTNGMQLVRQLPIFHPWFETLSAYSVSVLPYQPDSESAETLKQAAWYPDVTFDQAGYKWGRATIRFTNQPYEQLDDDEIDEYYGGSLEEWKRYCYDSHREGSLEIISQTGRLMKFAEGPPKALGASMPTEIGQILLKDVIEFTWKKVPKEYVCGTSDPENLALLKIDPCVGKLNATEFLGYPRGTLLLNPVRIVRMEPFLRVADEAAYYFDITFPFQHFDPPSTVNPQVYRGHNLMPWGGRIVDNQSASPEEYGRYFGSFYYATNDGNPTGTEAVPLLPYAEFRTMFQHADAPSPP